MEVEIWKDIKGFEGIYQISNLGRFRNRGEVKKPWTAAHGYLAFTLRKDGQKKNYKVHRLVAEAFIPNIENFPEINHIDGDKTNNRVENLEWCTHRYNMRHSYEIISAANSKIVRQIDPATGITVREYKRLKDVEMYGYSKSGVSRYLHGLCKGEYKGFRWECV